MKITHRILLFISAALVLALTARATPPLPPDSLPPAERGVHIVANGTVGVVMSGGGAKGLYHIGVLEVLEESGVPIDYVAGTSMGSIIAAMYAAGYSPAEMRLIVESGAVKEWVSGRIDPHYTPYYQQIGNNPAFLSVRLNLGNEGRRVNWTNILSSTPVDMALIELFAPASAAAGGDFDRLMVPFLCVASDVNAREPVVMRSGDLSEAVRASMSIPLVFKPLKIDSMLLYDGGIYDNFPWRPLDAGFRPDIIIGSICTSGFAPPDERNNIFEQAFALAMNKTDYELPHGRSITIRRAIESNMLDFDNAEAIMNAGREDALAAMPEILARIDRRWTAEQFAARREAFRDTCRPLVFNDYKLEGLSDAPQAYIRDFVRVDRHIAGRQRRMEFSMLRDNLYSVLAGGDFTMNFPKVTYDTLQQYYTFEAKFHTKPNFKVTLGGNLSSTAFNQIYIGVNYKKIARASQQLGAELYLGPLYTWGTLGGRTDFFMWKPLFLDYSYNFSFSRFNHGAFGNITKIDNTEQVKKAESFGSIAIGMPVRHRGALVLRTNGGHINYRYESDVLFASDTDLSRFSFFGAKVEYLRNTLDKYLYPRKGTDLSISTIFVTGRDKYRPFNEKEFISRTGRQWVGARFSWDIYFDMPRISWFSLGLNIDGVYTNHPKFASETATLMSMPAYTPIPHIQMVYMPDFRAARFIAGGIRPTFDFMHNFFLRTGFYAMYRDSRSYVPSTRVGQENSRWHYIAEASLVYHTPIGPVALSFSKYDLRSWKNMYLTFNFGYAIFAPKGTFY